MAKMNARMMRTKMALEVAAELYTRRMFSMGNVATIAIQPSSREEQFPGMTMGINGDLMGGMKGPLEVGKRRVDVAFINPSAVVTMAYRGKGFYKEKLPLRALASFPSWDKMAFAVAKDLKIKSISDIAARKIPLRVSTRSSGVYNTTNYTVEKILSLYGLSFGKIKRWGGRVHECPRPTSPERIAGIRSGKVNAVFDEGLHNWLGDALEHDFVGTVHHETTGDARLSTIDSSARQVRKTFTGHRHDRLQRLAADHSPLAQQRPGLCDLSGDRRAPERHSGGR
jgi:hypothetical protein